MKSVVDSFDRSSAASIGISQDLLADSEIKGSLAYISGNFSFLPITITWLEKRDESIHSVVKRIKGVEEHLQQCEGEIREKIKTTWATNQYLRKYCKMKMLTSEFDEDYSPGDLGHFKYAPLTSVEVERSFSMYRNVLPDNRRSFKPETLRMVMALYCNAD